MTTSNQFTTGVKTMAFTEYDWFAFNQDASAWHETQDDDNADDQCIDEDEV